MIFMDLPVACFFFQFFFMIQSTDQLYLWMQLDVKQSKIRVHSCSLRTDFVKESSSFSQLLLMYFYSANFILNKLSKTICFVFYGNKVQQMIYPFTPPILPKGQNDDQTKQLQHHLLPGLCWDFCWIIQSCIFKIRNSKFRYPNSS